MARATKTDSPARGSHARANRGVPANRGSLWTTRRARGLQVIQAQPLLKFPWLVHGFSTRPGGASTLGGKPVLNLGFTEWDKREAILKNRERFVAAAAGRGADKLALVTLRQFHSDVIYVADAPPCEAPNADALVTDVPRVLLGVQTADCVPVLLADTRRRVAAAIHAGWRGTLARIAVKTLGRMAMQFGTDPADVVAAVGPAIGQSCYEVGPEVAQAFAAQFPCAAEWFDGPFDQLAHGEEPLWLPWLTMMPPGHVPPPPRVQLDLRAANRWQLVDAGVPEKQIAVNDLCTACRTDLLFSYRREGKDTGRLMAVIGIR